MTVELVRSIDEAASLVITGTSGPDGLSLRRLSGGYLRRAGRVLASMGPGDDVLSVSGLGRDVEATLDGGPGSDSLTRLFGVNTSHPRKDSGPGEMLGGRDRCIGGAKRDRGCGCEQRFR